MKAIHFSRWLAVLGLGWCPLSGLAQGVLPDLQIAALTQSGQLTFSTVPGYTNYTVEWAPTPNGPWTNNWDQLRLIQPAANKITVAVPMFFRVEARGLPVTVPPGMAYVPSGNFVMGDIYLTNGTGYPLHTVGVNAFVVDRFEVSQALWNDVAAWAGTHGYQFDSLGAATAANHPIADISWYDAVKWCNARSEKEGLQPAYYVDGAQTTVYRIGALDLTNGCVAWTASGFRLPTEAEWEKAARGGVPNQFFPGYDLGTNYLISVLGPLGNFWGSGDPYDNGTTPVGFYNGFQSLNGMDMQNGFGLYDTAGNVAEMCWDWMSPYSLAQPSNPRGPDTGDMRIVRGGSWYEDYSNVRSGLRQQQYPNIPALDVGFRCVRSSGF